MICSFIKKIFFYALTIILLTQTALAFEVVLPFRGIKLLGNLEIAPKRSIQDGVIVMLHDSLLTHNHDTMNLLQTQLAEKGYNTLAITLSLSFTNRTSNLTCADSQLHKHTDALYELRAWHEWLINHRAGPLVLLGHGRGANQAVWYSMDALNDFRKNDIVGLITLAPMSFYPETISQGFSQQYGLDLADEYDWIEKSVGMVRDHAFLNCESTNFHSTSFTSYYQNDVRKHTPWLLSKSVIPSLVLLAQKDEIEPSLAHEMLNNPNRQTIWENSLILGIPNANHDFQDDALKQVVFTIDKFMLGRFEQYTHFRTKP